MLLCQTICCTFGPLCTDKVRPHSPLLTLEPLNVYVHNHCAYAKSSEAINSNDYSNSTFFFCYICYIFCSLYVRNWLESNIQHSRGLMGDQKKAAVRRYLSEWITVCQFILTALLSQSKAIVVRSPHFKFFFSF